MSNPAQAATDVATLVAAYYMEITRCGLPIEAAVSLALGFQELLFDLRFDAKKDEEDDD